MLAFSEQSSSLPNQKKTALKTYIENEVEDRLEDDDVLVARSLRQLLLLVHVLILVVDVLIVLLRHSA